MRFSKAEKRILELCWKLGTRSACEILNSLPAEERVAYTTVQTLVYRLEQKGALRKVKKLAMHKCSSQPSTRAIAGAGRFETSWNYSADRRACWCPIF